MAFLDSLKHAFAIESDAPVEPADEQRVLVERLCREVVRRRLTTPALMMLEMSRPLGFLAAQAIHFFTPLISAVTDADGHRQLAAFLEHRQAVEFLCRRIEELEAEQSQPRQSGSVTKSIPEFCNRSQESGVTGPKPAPDP